jgi:hypothetical protein
MEEEGHLVLLKNRFFLNSLPTHFYYENKSSFHQKKGSQAGDEYVLNCYKIHYIKKILLFQPNKKIPWHLYARVFKHWCAGITYPTTLYR